MNKSRILDEIFDNDPMGLLDVRKKASNMRTPDDRLLASFGEINDFVGQHGKEPSANPGNISEYRLHARLKGLRSDPVKIELLQEVDIHELLPRPPQANEPILKYNKNPKSLESIDDILDDVGDFEMLGKEPYEDIRNNKFTYPSILGLDKARQTAEKLISDAHKLIKNMPNNQIRVEFVKMIKDRLP